MTANITGKITGIKYIPLLGEQLQGYDFAQFDINSVPKACVVHDGKYTFALSKWVSPKRSRTYPFAGVYNTLCHSKKITVIPVVKDEGEEGDRDYIQWDTVSLMSLLDVFVIFAYYDTAVVNPRNKQKITRQQFNTKFVNEKIREIEQYHSSALHWNLNELKSNFHHIFDKACAAYQKIEKKTGVLLHSQEGLENFKKKIGRDVADFMNFSRHKSEQAQKRETVTIQPKESLQSTNKATITIFNYLGGAYFLTADEINLTSKKVILIESKHSKKSLLSSVGDIKDGLLKMILFSNLTDVMVGKKTMASEAVLVFTSPVIKGSVHSKDSDKVINAFLEQNKFTAKRRKLINTLFNEANKNNFIVEIRYSQ
jgi:hypothetical protein